MNEKLQIIISAEISKLKQNVEKAKSNISDFQKQVEKAKANVDDNFKQIGNSISSSLKTAGVAITAAGAALLALGASTEEYRNQQAKLTTAFEAAGAGAETAKNTYNDLYRVLGDGGQATEAASHLAKLTTEEKALSEWTNICQGVYATFGDSLPIESLTEAANETAKTGALTGGLADALNWAGVSEEAFQEKLDACNTEAEREALIRQTLNGLYDDAAKKYEVNNKEVLAQNEAQAKLQENTAKLGEALAPVITAFTEFASNALAVVTPYIQDLAEKFLPPLKDVLEVVGDIVGAIFQTLADNWEIVLTIAGVIGGITTAIGLYNAVAAIKAAMAAAEVATVWGLVAAYAAQAVAMMAAIAPYVLIVAAIAAVIAIIVLCVKYWDEIVAAVKKAVEIIVEWVSNLFESIVNALAAAWDWITGLLSTVASWIYDTVIAPVVNFFADMWDSVKNGAKAAWDGIKSVFSSVANFFGNIFSTAWEKVKKVFSVGGKIFSGIKDGIITAFKAVVNTIIKGINTIVALPFDGLNGILNKIQNISFLGISPFSWLTWRSPVPKIPLLAQGGVVDSATLAMIGERGKEAVVPLENNLEWLDKLANMLSQRMGGGAPIILQVDGKTFAEISVDSINQLTRQRGSLPLVIA